MRHSLFLMPMLIFSFATHLSASLLPETTPCPDQLTNIATCYAAKLDTGAYLFAAMPKNWNGDLIVFAHGGPSLDPPIALSGRSDISRFSVEVELGFAWVGSSYRREGYGVQMAASDTDDARQFFITNIAQPRRTIVHGSSYGGLVAVKLLETRPGYDGALLTSGLLSGSAVGYEFRADLRAVYQYYCRNLPRLDEPQYPLWQGLPADSPLTLTTLTALVDECTGISKRANERTPLQRRNLTNILGVMGFSEQVLVRHVQAGTFTFRDIATRVTNGRSAYSNIGIRYKGSDDDDALNRDVVRFEADPAAREALMADGQPNGTLRVPMVSIHSINDPQVTVEVESVYRQVLEEANNLDRLVQAFTDENQHVGQSAPEVAAALNALMQWIDKSIKPTAETIAKGCEELRDHYSGPCRYHPEFSPNPFSAKYYPRNHK